LKEFLNTDNSSFGDMASAVKKMADIIYEWKNLGKAGSEAQSSAGPLMNDSGQMGASDGYSMTGVYRLSADKFGDYDTSIGSAVKAWKESKEIKIEQTNKNTSGMSLDEIRAQLASGEYKPFENTPDIESVRSEYINSKLLQSIDFFGKAQSIYDRINTMIKKWRWIY
jgi:hypothetical protein